MKNDFILASGSPRRKDILEKAGFKFDIIKSNYDEKMDNLDFSVSKIELNAQKKAQDVATRYPNDAILSADTVVVLDNHIFGKPKSRDDAYEMLKNLSGKTHFVLTAICLISNDKIYTTHTKTDVTFNQLSDKMIYDYIDNFKPYDKAGAYGIQELPPNYVKSTNGDIETVIGLSLTAVKELLRNIK